MQIKCQTIVISLLLFIVSFIVKNIFGNFLFSQTLFKLVCLTTDNNSRGSRLFKLSDA